jgi:hypothetical protein
MESGDRCLKNRQKDAFRKMCSPYREKSRERNMEPLKGGSLSRPVPRVEGT